MTSCLWQPLFYKQVSVKTSDNFQGLREAVREKLAENSSCPITLDSFLPEEPGLVRGYFYLVAGTQVPCLLSPTAIGSWMGKTERGDYVANCFFNSGEFVRQVYAFSATYNGSEHEKPWENIQIHLFSSAELK